jgi:hypothetical protein
VRLALTEATDAARLTVTAVTDKNMTLAPVNRSRMFAPRYTRFLFRFGYSRL